MTLSRFCAPIAALVLIGVGAATQVLPQHHAKSGSAITADDTATVGLQVGLVLPPLPLPLPSGDGLPTCC